MTHFYFTFPTLFCLQTDQLSGSLLSEPGGGDSSPPDLAGADSGQGPVIARAIKRALEPVMTELKYVKKMVS